MPVREPSEADLVLDQSKLGSDSTDVYIFQYISGALRAVKALSQDALKPQVSTFESTLLSIARSSAPFTSPAGHPIRIMISKCLVAIYAKGETRGLYDTVTKFLVTAGDLKERDGVRVSAFYCLGELMYHNGSQVMSCMNEFAQLALKTYKMSSIVPVIRYHALQALCKSLPTAGRALNDSFLKDVHKNMRSALLDRSLPVQRAACAVLTELYPLASDPSSSKSTLPTQISLGDLESVLAQIVKSMDGAECDNITRLSLAKLAAHLLALSQIPRTVATVAPKSGAAQASLTGDDAGAGSKSTAETTSKPLLSPVEMLSHIAIWMNKQSTTRKQRVGLIHTYNALLHLLGGSWVESHYSTLLSFLAKDMLQAPKVAASTKAERAWTRKAAGILLKDVIRERMLSEQGLISALTECVNGYIRPHLSAILYKEKGSGPTGQPQNAAASFIRSQSIERPPSPETLIIVLKEIAGMLKQLGNAPPETQELLGGGEVLITVACSASGAALRGAAVAALCAFICACPGRMSSVLESLNEGLKKDITTLGTLASQAASSAAPSSSGIPSLEEIKTRSLGHAYSLYGVYTLLATTVDDPDPNNPSGNKHAHMSSLHLYLPPLSLGLFHTATALLKSTLDQPLSIARVNSEIGWTILSGLMALGPQFVKANLSALMVLWRNALPKPTVRDTSGVVGKDEWAFLLGVRGWAVGAMCAFLRWNNTSVGGGRDNRGQRNPLGGDSSAGTVLVTLDVARRLGTLLNNALGFANLFISTQKEETVDPTSPNASTPMPRSAYQVDEDGMDMQAYEALLRSHIHVAFSLLGFSTLTESVQRELITSTISLFSGNDSYSGSGLQAAIAVREGTFKGVWKSEDGYAYGVTSIELGEEKDGDGGSNTAGGSGGAGGIGAGGDSSRGAKDGVELEIDNLLVRPILGSFENDPLALVASFSGSTTPDISNEPVPPVTAVVDTAIELFANLLVVQDANGAFKALNRLVETLQGDYQPNMGRKIAVTVNAVSALLIALRLVMSRGSAGKSGRETFGVSQVASLFGDLLRVGVLDSNEILRQAATEGIGRLVSLSSSSFLGNQINHFVNEIVNNRDPNSRAGCAATFGAIFIHAGGVACQPYLKTVLNVLMSLGNDPHPTVHYASLQALAQIVSASSLFYGPYNSSTLGYVFKVYMLESHEPEGGTQIQANASGDLPLYQVLCQIVDGVISAIGPELQDSVRSTSLILDLAHVMLEESDGVTVEAIQCLRQILMFAPNVIDVPDLVRQFRDYLASPKRPLKAASINALYQLVQRDAFLLSKVGGDKLVETLFAMLDEDDATSTEGVKSIITSWLSQTVTAAPSAWIDLCQRIMAKTTAASQQAISATDSKTSGLQDDEAESLGAQVGGDAKKSHSTARWRTQLFAMECLHTICTIVAASGRREHIDLRFAKQQGIQPKGLLVSRVADLIKMAFSASAAYVMEIRLTGLLVLKDVIEIFSKSPDPDFEGAHLLEQHQAPITAALTPAFSSDSTPEILSSAIRVCAIFVGCGVIKDVSKMGRILKLLTGALERCKASDAFKIGDVQNLSPNAAVMLKISTLTAWAELQISSVNEEYLVAVVKPHRPTLAVLWVGALRDYASIRGDSEMMQDTASGAMDAMYLNLGKEVLLPYYDESWHRILKAVASLMQAKDPNIVAAMDGKDDGLPTPTPESSFRRNGPTAFFFIIFGLVYEALAQSSTSSASATSNQEVSVAALEALESLVRPEYAGDAIMETTIFEEFTSLCYRMAMMETTAVQLPLIRAVASLAGSQCGNSNDFTPTATGERSGDILPASPLAHCLRICSYMLRRALPSTTGSGQDISPSDRVLLLKNAFSALSQIGSVIDASQKEDVRNVSLSLYSELLKNETLEYDLVGPTLPALKVLLDNPPSIADGSAESSYAKVIHGLTSCCLQNIDETSNRSGPIASLKVKNNMLAAVLVLTTMPNTMKLSRALVEQCCYLISQRLSEPSEVLLTAAHCAKTLITASLSPTSNPILKYCAGLLLPGLITLLSEVATAVDDADKFKAYAPALDEALKAFTLFFASVPEEGREGTLAVLLPAFALILDPTRSPPSPPHTQAMPIVLGFATAAPAAFKEVTERLDASVRERLEASVRNAIGGGQKAAQPAPTKRQISLKAF